MQMNPSDKLNGFELEIVPVYKYLGVDFDNRLTFVRTYYQNGEFSWEYVGSLCRSLRKWAPVETFSKAILSTTLPISLYSMACTNLK
jgi:hypothetical protein